MKRQHAVIRWIGLTGLVLAVLVGAGCASSRQEKESDLFFDEWEAKAKVSEAKSPPPLTRRMPATDAFILEEVVKFGGKAKPERELPTQKVTLDLRRKADVTVVLRALARLADQDILFGDNVKGDVYFNFQDAPWDQAFLGVLQTQGLTYRWVGDIIRVMTPEDMARDLEIDRIEQQQRELLLAAQKTAPLEVHTVKIRFANAENLVEHLRQMLREGTETTSRSSVHVDKDSNTVILKAVRTDIVQMLQLIDKLDTPTPQVKIEANIVEANRGTARELGVQWGGLAGYRDGNHNYWITPGANADGVMGNSLTPAINPESGMAANFPVSLTSPFDDNSALEQIAGDGFTLGFVSESVGQYLLNVQLSALQEDGLINILSSPSITTLDNQPAMIESGEERAYQKDNSGGAYQSTSVEWKKAVLKLEVTPHVIGDDLLKIKIVAHKDEFGRLDQAIDGQLPVYTKKAETTLILFNGQTTVIGGLSKESRRTGESGVPFLKDIPLLGRLFRSDSREKDLDDLLIFITPSILPAAGDPEATVEVRESFVVPPSSMRSGESLIKTDGE